MEAKDVRLFGQQSGITQRTLIKDLSEDLFDQLVNVHSLQRPGFSHAKVTPAHIRRGTRRQYLERDYGEVPPALSCL